MSTQLHEPENPLGGDVDGDDAFFQEMSLTRGELRIVWEYIGEGWQGEFGEVEDDEPLLRFTVYRHVDDPALREELGGSDDDPWIPVEDSSYCTRMPVMTPVATLRRALELMMDRVESDFHADDYGCGVKRTCEELSWFEPASVERADARA